MDRDLKEVKELALQILRGSTDTGKFPMAGPGLMYLRNSKDDSFVEWKGHVGVWSKKNE